MLLVVVPEEHRELLLLLVPEERLVIHLRFRERVAHLHTSAHVRTRQHMSAYASIRPHTSAYVRIRQHTSAFGSIRQHTSAYVSIRQHTSAYVSIRQHTSAFVSIRQHTSRQHTSALRQHSSAFVSIGEDAETWATCMGLHGSSKLREPICCATRLSRSNRGASRMPEERIRQHTHTSAALHGSAVRTEVRRGCLKSAYVSIRMRLLRYTAQPFEQRRVADA